MTLALVMTVGLMVPSAGSATAVNPSMVRISADRQNYNVTAKRYTLNGNVSVAYQNIHITGSEAIMRLNDTGAPEVAHFYNRPTFRRTAPNMGEDRMIGDEIQLYLAEDRFGAQGNVVSNIATVAADPFVIRSDVQQFDNRNKVMSASGNVHVDYKGSKAMSKLANVRMDDAGKAERVIFTGTAKLHQDASIIAGEKITVMVGSGNLVAEQGVKTQVDLKAEANSPTRVVITSDYQQYDKASDTMLASGHVKVIYGDYIAVGPKATFKLRNGELDRILLTGRPTITEGPRTITADKITITTNPKNFDAVGNVKVNFHKQDEKPGAAAPTAKPAAGQTPASETPQLPVDDPSDY